jgi:threonine/homoserine/homoserine lactone efflux protein
VLLGLDIAYTTRHACGEQSWRHSPVTARPFGVGSLPHRDDRAMPDASTLLLFAAASLALLAVPGPAVLFIVARSLEQGRGAGMASVLGVHAGTLVHVAAAAAGVSALVASSATAFAVVKYAGAAYLIALGVQRLRRRTPDDPLAAAPAEPRRRLARQGFVVNVLNPKTAVFFLAFLPQFVAPGAGPVALQVTVLGLTFVALGLVTDGLWALAAGSAGARVRRNPAVRRWLDRTSGGVHVGLGMAAALGGERGGRA